MGIDILRQPYHFEWDNGNAQKNWVKHRVSTTECEEVFFDPHKRIAKKLVHSSGETRYLLLGQTKKEQFIFIVFTVRKDKIRIISARDLNKRERKLL
jgi:uncharacterized protein